jgi:hypothetical protein
MFLVQRSALDWFGGVCQDQNGRDTGSRVLLKAFADWGAAEAYRRELIAQGQQTLSPFHLLPTDLPDELRTMLRELELPLPCPQDESNESWRAWWESSPDELTDEQRAAVWNVLGPRLYEIVAVEVAP